MWSCTACLSIYLYLSIADDGGRGRFKMNVCLGGYCYSNICALYVSQFHILFEVDVRAQIYSQAILSGFFNCMYTNTNPCKSGLIHRPVGLVPSTGRGLLNLYLCSCVIIQLLNFLFYFYFFYSFSMFSAKYMSSFQCPRERTAFLVACQRLFNWISKIPWLIYEYWYLSLCS